ncbi:ParB/RepB/Spo0J family partition protein [Pantoea sp. Morm]|uniref:ParB/RepB/Spo0J family partition protein n=1 Tax=Pantoea sp. Morm TaxID=2601250 RepID=UPI0031FC8848
MAVSKFQKQLSKLKSGHAPALPDVAASVGVRDAPAPVGTPESTTMRAEIARPGPEPEGQIIRVKADEIYEVEQVRPEGDFDEEIISGMVDSFSELGNLTPPRCFPRDRQGYRVWFGATRVRSMKKRGDEFIDIYVGRPPRDEKQRIMGQLIENLQQSGLRPLATALAFETLKREFGMSGEEIARALGKPTAFVSKHMRISAAPEKIKALLQKRLISDVDSAYMLVQLDALDESKSDNLIGKIAQGQSISRARIKKELNTLKGRSAVTLPTGREISHAKSPPPDSDDTALDRENISEAECRAKGVSLTDDKLASTGALVPVVSVDGAEGILMLEREPEEYGWVWVRTTQGELHIEASAVTLLGMRVVG